MFNDLKPVAKALVTAHFARTNFGTVNMPENLAPPYCAGFLLGD